MFWLSLAPSVSGWKAGWEEKAERTEEEEEEKERECRLDVGRQYVRDSERLWREK